MQKALTICLIILLCTSLIDVSAQHKYIDPGRTQQVYINQQSKTVSGFNTGDTLKIISGIKPGGAEEALMDDATGTKYILDSGRTTIKAVDIHGNIVWRTNPQLDCNLEPYRSGTLQFICEFGITSKALNIRYANSQFGAIDKQTGKCSPFGRD